ncbi:ribonuclease D [Anaplasmataceae bacterium AB001_6]|nr:ribonuclease D [Anaplasmataceae bacterium AB001_6]
MGLLYCRDRLCLIQITDLNNKPHLIQFDGKDYSATNLKKILTDNSILKILHYARFDVGIIKYYLGVDVNPIYCTKIASRLARTYTDSHGLKDLCHDILGIKLNKSQQSSDWGNFDLSIEQRRYAASDVIYLVQLHDKLNEILLREGRMDIASKCFKFLNTRVELDLIGWPDIDIFSHFAKRV